MRVLVVEDSPANQLLARAQLSRLGYEPEIAESGERALELLTQTAYDAVLMDWHMPGIDGLETTRRIRASGEFTGLPIIAMTANAVAGDRETCLEAGMDDYLSKPVSIGDLEFMLHRWLGDADGSEATDAAAGSEPDDGVVDWSVLDTLAEEVGDPSLIDTLVQAFLEEMPTQVASIALLQSGADPHDIDAASRAAHTLKSTAATMGAKRLATRSSELEQQLRSADSDVAETARAVVSLAEQTTTAFNARLEKAE